MKNYLTIDDLKAIYEYLTPKLLTGKDKITPDKFSKIQNNEFEIIIRKCKNHSYHFTNLKKIKTKNNRNVFIPTIRDRIVLEALKISLKNKFKTNFLNRNEIIEIIIRKLSSNQNLHIFKYDIKKFFNSIPHNFLLHKLKKTTLLSSIEYSLIVNLLKCIPKKGLPTGISLNNILTEIYLEEIDLYFKKSRLSISNYFRYVDDILFIFNGELLPNEKYDFDNFVINTLKNFGLRINHKKKESVVINQDDDEKTFSYLGYSFSKRARNLTLKISNKKINKIKNKILFSFNEYRHNNNLELLLERLNFIANKNTMLRYNYKLNRNFVKVQRPILLQYGAVEDYKFVSIEQWKELDEFLRGNIHNIISPTILNNKRIKNKLFKISFEYSFLKKRVNRYHKFSNDDYINLILKIDNTKTRGQLILLNRNELEIEYKNILKV